jgi:hypothetical protein
MLNKNFMLNIPLRCSMKKSYPLLLIIISFLSILNLCSAQNKGILKLENLKCEYQINPRGVEKEQPFLSWEINLIEQKKELLRLKWWRR